MKTTFQLSVLAVLGLSVVASAAPTVGPMGPSAKMAARLKKNPAPSWLAHYLPDDRYKIAGGIWKYVSTDLDTYVHLPNSPLMLRQSADSVIGFASIADAEEAGYTPEPGLSVASSFGGGSDSSPAAFKSSQKVTTSDGKSTIVLPGGWRKLKGMTLPLQGGTITVDLYMGPHGQTITVTSATAPPNANVDFGHILTVQSVKNSQAQVGNLANSLKILTQRSTPMANGFNPQNFAQQFDEMRKNQSIAPVTLGGISGVSVNNNGTLVPGQPRRQFTVGRGRQMWSVAGSWQGKDDVAGVMKTFEPR